jgi:CubicO group peptidase (beta-lactamase class C family)
LLAKVKFSTTEVVKTLLLMSVGSTATAISPLDAAPPEMKSVRAKMEQLTQAGEVAGSVTLVANHEEILHLAASGMANQEKSLPMTTEQIFWIASMTKPVTATAVMMMEEKGLLSVKDRISKYLPEFSNLKDAAGNPVTITIEQCLIHSSGLSELSPAEIGGCSTLEELVPLIAGKPVAFSPGSRWAYCQSGINMAARVVEVVSGEQIPDFLQGNLFGPLGMPDTGFYLKEDQLPRLATPYRRTSAGELEATGFFFLNGKSPSVRDRVPMANGGLFSTAKDYAKFAQMILRGGEFDGKRFLTTESVKKMTSVQSGALSAGFIPGSAWGLGWGIVCEPQGVSAALSQGSFGHGGLFGTQCWIDPMKNRIFLLLIQRADLTNSDASNIRCEFQNAAALFP